MPGDWIVGDIALDGVKGDGGIGRPGDTTGNPYLRCGKASPKASEDGGPARIGQPRTGVTSGGTHNPGQVRRLDVVRVDHDQVADAQVGEVLDDEGPRPAGADDADLLPPKDLLAPVTEESG